MLNMIHHKYGNLIRTSFALLLFLPIFMANQASGSDRLYFVSITEEIGPQILLEWGPMEGELPSTITEFRLYRSKGGEEHKPVPTSLGNGRIANALVREDEIRGFVNADPDINRKKELLSRLEEIRLSQEPHYDPITGTNFQIYLHQLLDPNSKGYDPMQRMLFIRSFPAVAQACGLAYVDNDIPGGGPYHYILTAVTSSGESLPIGQSENIDPRIPTILPAPEGFQQIKIFGCSEIRKNLDDNLIHFNWTIPVDPALLGLKILTYGYDVYWSEKQLASPDFRAGVPEGTYKVNTAPILAAGPPPAEGPDSFLARDDGSSHTTGPAWKRGQQYYYYLVARDLSGHYSEVALLRDPTLNEIPAIVVDSHPPKAPWNIHTEELNSTETGDPTAPTIQQLALVWDQVNPVNYVRYFGSNKNICGTEDGKVCYTTGEATCSDAAKVRCADLDVDHYDVYRFDSPEEASHWGLDTDSDMWPDALEDTLHYDKCDDLSPGSIPLEHVVAINQNSSADQRQLAETQTQMYFVDQSITADNKVRWYRIIAVDSVGNQSSISPPIRGVLYDRQQPKVNADLQAEECEYSVLKEGDCAQKDTNYVLNLFDGTGKDAASYSFYQSCEDIETKTIIFNRQLLHEKIDQRADISKEMLAAYGTDPSCGPGGKTRTRKFFIRFFDRDSKLLAESVHFTMGQFQGYNGCVTLTKECPWISTGPGFIPAGPIRVCVDLSAGESARIYHQNADGMSPFQTIEPVDTDGTTCVSVDDLPGLVPADLCFGVRVFSGNHVGSGIKYLNCLELKAYSDMPPEAPLIAAVDSTTDSNKDPQFTVRWSAAGDGLSAFLVEWRHESEIRYETTWDLQPNDIGQYQLPFALATEDLNKEWCFRVKAVDSAMQSSAWSQGKCGTWELGAPENLPWPPVAEPEEGAAMNAFYLVEQTPYPAFPTYGLPAIVLSDDLSSQLDLLYDNHANQACSADVPICQQEKGVDCMRLDNTRTFYWNDCSSVCEILSAAAVANNFIVYRQENGKDFVQVSPLLENFHCSLTDGGQNEIFAVINDPFILLRNLQATSIAGVGADTTIAEGIRLLFQDRYPHIPGTQVRYKVLAINSSSGEIETVHTTNWVTIP